ncbi:DUF4123 domain-containing protein, partial [Rodentibacter caecimuris]|uniref:DUF4123 domain-containing protein n=1 Tax=Rodentibacter caecimuris TaxID=1796644 RepID=UPI00101AEB52
MIELLLKEQQEQVINDFIPLINPYLEKQKHIYVILEPMEDDEVNHIFLKTGMSYTEPVSLFDNRLEDVGPRISELGKNKDFDRWIIEKALFHRWTALFISDVDLTTFTEHISYLCNAVTFEHKSVIFRMYPPTILNEWLTALQKENQAYRALGICSDILYVMDFPEQVAHYHFENNLVTRQELDLLNHQTQEIAVPVEFDSIDIPTDEKWWLTENQVNSLNYARAYHLVHKFRKHFLVIPSIREKYSVQEVHKYIVRIVNLCFKYKITEIYLMQELTGLYFNYAKSWGDSEKIIISILENNDARKEAILE